MPERIRIAYVINDLLLGGAQQTILALTKRLDRDAYEPIVFYQNEYPDDRLNLKAAFVENGIPVHFVGTHGKSSILRTIFGLRKAFKEWRPHIVHCHLTDATIAGTIAARTRGISRIIIHEHQTHKLYSWKIRFAYRFLRPFARLTICFSPVVEAELFGDSHLLTDPLTSLARSSCSIYNGIDMERVVQVKNSTNRALKREELSLPLDSLLITSVGRLISWKGQMTLLEAFGKIIHEYPNAYLCLIGEGPLKDTLMSRAGEIGISDHVRVLGARLDVYDILSVTDIGSLSLVYAPGMVGETVGVAGFEMMGFGLPLIVSDYPSTKAYVHDAETAVLVPPGDVSVLRQKLSLLLSDAALRARIGEAAAAYIQKNMNWNTLVPVYDSVYRLISAT